MEIFLWFVVILQALFITAQCLIVTHFRKQETQTAYSPSNEMIKHLQAELEMKTELRKRLNECQARNNELTLRLASSEEALHSAMDEVDKLNNALT